MERLLCRLRSISTGLGLAALILGLAAALTVGVVNAATDFDSEFRQLAGLVVSGDDDTAGVFRISNGDGTYTDIDSASGVNLWTYDSGLGTLTPVLTSGEYVNLPSAGTALVVDGASAGSSATPAIAVTAQGDAPGIKVTQDDGPAIYLRGVGTAAGAQAWFEENSSAPPTPGTNEWAFYFKSDGLYFMDDAGTETGPLGTGGGGGMTSFTLAGDAGSSQTISNSNTLTVAGGTNGIDTSAGATDTLTINLDLTEVNDATIGNNSDSQIQWTFDPSGAGASYLYSEAGMMGLQGATSVDVTAPYLKVHNGATSGGAVRLFEDSDFGTNSYEFVCTGPMTADMSIGLKYDATLNDGDVLTYHAMGSTWDTPATVYYQTVKDEGSAETQRSNLNFIGDNVDVTDDGGNDETEVTIHDWQDHMSSIGHGLSAINATDVTAGTSNTSYCVYVGTAVKSYTTCTVNVQVTTAVATSITWAEVAIATGDWVPNGNPALTTRGSTSVTASYNSLGTKSTTISLSGISPGDDIWFVWGSQATTPFVLRAIQDDISNLGLTGSAAATRPSTMGAGTTFTRSSTNNPARVVVGL